jgi:hypothetical protein
MFIRQPLEEPHEVYKPTRTSMAFSIQRTQLVWGKFNPGFPLLRHPNQARARLLGTLVPHFIGGAAQKRDVESQ